MRLTKSKRRSFAMMLVVAMILTMMPLTALAAPPANVEIYLSGATDPHPTVVTQDGDTVESIYARTTGQSYPGNMLYKMNGELGSVAPGGCVVTDNAYIEYYSINNFQTDQFATISDEGLILIDGRIKVLDGKTYRWRGLEQSLNMSAPSYQSASVTVTPKNSSTPLTMPVKLSDYDGISMDSSNGIKTYMPIDVVANYNAYTTELNKGLEKVIAIANSIGINTSNAVSALNGTDNAVKATEKVNLGSAIVNATVNQDVMLSNVAFSDSVAVSTIFDAYVPNYTLVSTTGTSIVPATFTVNPDTMDSSATVTYSSTDAQVSFAGNVLSASAAGTYSFSIKVAKGGAERTYKFTFTCSEPIVVGDPTVYAFLPAPGQFTNEGVTVGGWGDIYLSGTDGLKPMAENVTSTGVSLGYFGGYTVFDMGNIDNDANHKYGVDFIVYGNAFWGNSEPGCIQVAQANSEGKPDTWYDIAGSLYYDDSTVKNYSLTYENPTPNDNITHTTAGNNLGTLASVHYTGSATGTIVKNNFHNHSWFPLVCNYFTGRNGNPALDKTTILPFASYNDAQSKLTLTGTMLGGITSTGTVPSLAFGYCDVHPNGGGDKATPYNPYGIGAITSSSNFNTYIAGTGGGNPIDISWAVDSNGNPVDLNSIRFVRIYTGTAAMNGIFGEISTEVRGIKKAVSTGGTVPTTIPTINVDGMTLDDLEAMGMLISTTSISANQKIITISGLADNYSDMFTLSVSGYNKFSINNISSTQYDVTLKSNGDTLIRVIGQTGDQSPYIVLLKLS